MPRLENYILRFKRILERPDFSMLKVSWPAPREELDILQIAIFVTTHTVDFMGHVVKVRVLKRMLLHVKDHMECRLVYFERLKGLDMGKVLSCRPVAFVLADWVTSPREVGFDGVNMLFPATSFPFEFMHFKS
jgi:hypothetical protein